MTISLRDVLQLDSLNDLEVISGHGGLDNIIENVNVIEIPNIEEWLRENELIITAFHAIGDSKSDCLNLIKKMVETGVPGLVIAPEFYLEKSDDYIDEIIELSNNLNFPIIKLPTHRTYSDIIKIILEKIFEKNLGIKWGERKKEFFCSLLQGKYKTIDTVHKLADSIKVDLFGLGTVMNIKVDFLSKNKESEIIQSNIKKTITYKLSQLDNLIVLTIYKDIVVLPIFHYDGDNKKSILKLQLDIAKDIKYYIEQSIDSIDVFIGIGRHYEDILDINRSYQEAQKVLSVSDCMSDRIVAFENLKILKLLTKIEDKEELKIFLTEALYSLEKYDKDNRTDYVNTLKTYLECNENVQISAMTMYVHINTIKYRISKIKEILEIDELETDKKVELFIAFKIKEILGN